MKTVRISDETYKKITAALGTLIAQTGKMQTYQDTIENMLNQSVTLPTELLQEIEKYIQKNKGYESKEEFICQAICLYLKWESDEYKYFKIPKEKYEKLKRAFREMNTPNGSRHEFLKGQIEKVVKEKVTWNE